MFFRGQEVECIHSGPWYDGYDKPDTTNMVPQFKHVYRIRSVENIDGAFWLRFYEFVNPPGISGNEPRFHQEGFRIVIRLKNESKIKEKLRA